MSDFNVTRKTVGALTSSPRRTFQLSSLSPDTYPKRRGLTRVKELWESGINVCFGQDSINDPWYRVGSGSLIEHYNLDDLADFTGNYVAADAGVTLGGGMSAMAMRNQNGVVMTLTAVQQGVRLSLAGRGKGWRGITYRRGRQTAEAFSSSPATMSSSCRHLNVKGL